MENQVKNDANPITFTLPSDGYHKGVLWAGLADRWRNKPMFCLVGGKWVTDAWEGSLVNSSSN